MPSRALAFVAGAWLLQQQAVLPGPLWIYLLPIAGFAIVLWNRADDARTRRIAALLWLPWFGIAGFLIAALWAHVRLADALPAQWEGRDVRIRGVIAEMPRENAIGTARFVFDVEAVATPSAHVPARISLNWYVPSPSAPPRPVLKPGQRWQLTVRLRRPHAVANPHGPDLEQWLLERGIRAVGYVRPQDQRLLESVVSTPRYQLERMRAAARERITSTLAGFPSAGVLAALAIGDQQSISREQWTLFTRTGVNHLMSISGLHITMLSGLAFALAVRVWSRCPRCARGVSAQRAAAAIGLAVGVAYALLAGFAVPARRTVLMLAVVALAMWRGRPIRGRDTLALAALVVVAFDPWAVVAAGFWLSFGAVAVIMFVGSGRLHPGSLVLQWGRVQWAITLGLIPLLLLMFQQVSLVSPLANALAIPLVSLAVVPATLLGLIMPFDLLLKAAGHIMQWGLTVLAYLSELSLAVWEQHAPIAWTVPAALLGITWLLAPAGVPARWLGLGALLPLLWLQPARPPAGEAWLDVLDVGQGQAVLIRTRAHALLYDAGPTYHGEAEAGSRIVVPHLRALGVRRLDGLIVSHDDSDHSGGAPAVLDAHPQSWVLSSAPAYARASTPWPRGERCLRGQRWVWDGVTFEVLHPERADYNRSAVRDNDLSCVLRVRSARYTVLLSGDIERASEAALLRRVPGQLRADVLLAPHHGSATSSTPEFLRQVQPRIAIFTVGYRNRFGHPAAAVQERYARLGIVQRRSDMDGALALRLGSELSLSAWREAHPRYWQGR